MTALKRVPTDPKRADTGVAQSAVLTGFQRGSLLGHRGTLERGARTVSMSQRWATRPNGCKISRMQSLARMIPDHWPRELQELFPRLADSGGLDSVRVQTRSLPCQNGALEAIRCFHAAAHLPNHTHTTGLVKALLFYAADALDEAHAIFQAVETFAGSYGHGMLHRREGDFWNANYWFRHAGQAPKGVFAHGFNPVQLTNECQRFASGGPAQAPLLIHQIRQEWLALMDALLDGRAV